MSDVRQPETRERGSRTQNWQGTLNNYSEADIELFKALYPEKASYVLIGKEVAPTTNMAHIHVYIQFIQRKERSAVKKIHTQVHWEACKGTAEQNFKYATKEDENFIEIGTICKSNTEAGRPTAERSDKLAEAFQQWQTLEDFMEHEVTLYGRYKNGVEALYKLRQKKMGQKKIPPFVIWLAGFTECGKTRIAYEIAQWIMKEEMPFVTGDNLKWFDDYETQKVAIFDDLRKKDCNFNWLLRLLDRYPVTVQQKAIKGGSFFNPTVIVVTCPRIPCKEFVFKNSYKGGEEEEYEDVGQLTRRCHVIIEWKRELGTITQTFLKGRIEWEEFKRINQPKEAQAEQENETSIQMMFDSQ